MKLPILSSQEVCKFLEKEGFVLIRQKGSHRFYKHPDKRTTLVPIHPNRPISRGLLKGILNEIDMDREAFFKDFYRKDNK
ncbi:MAG: type II toxin-antitoxin system HicA family toxin [Candidatus Aenigmarchaeota archaeon]|nr:type II toxin-antitoxin system HicA family toxin [Candidatus Aenigmarchaeota archaeon]MCK5373004.1 type II toxin-antitoxin system HicA family toxin [Candidatus Aenigmarchaeota archaeon]MCK5452097.1 type II toxin-antitoxin system HicA family toxin [Candidatus Aenigmarchaeota archaeon]